MRQEFVERWDMMRAGSNTSTALQKWSCIADEPSNIHLPANENWEGRGGRRVMKKRTCGAKRKGSRGERGERQVGWWQVKRLKYETNNRDENKKESGSHFRAL